MPKRTDLHSILLIGSGPIIIGQACEFDYSGVQACKALREEGYRVILINSNPATIMTDPEFADRTYIEPITPEIVEKIIEREKPDALLPTLGGQTALNTAMSLFESGVLTKHGVQMIGANAEAIKKGEDRQLFKEAMEKIGLDMPVSGTAHNMEEAREVAARIGTFPLIIRPAFTMGGTGGGIGYNREEFEEIVKRGIDLSPVSEVLIEESLLGWKEYEMEVMRDRADNCVIICSIENFDPMGVHTGDSITVAPAQTLTDKEYQIMRDASFAVIREIGVETGGSNIQFSVDPKTGRMIVIEMNPRVSRSSALASKATGFPIAKIAAKLAVGYTLDEIRNDITRETPASFEPTIDYVVTKIPRFTFEKFPQTDATLTTQMKSVGEAMAIGRTFKESLQKALRSLEVGAWGFGGGKYGGREIPPKELIQQKLVTPNDARIFYIRHAMRAGFEAAWPDVDLHGLVVTPYGHALPPAPGAPPARIVVAEASHPVPDEAGLDASRRILALAATAGPDDLVLALVSGGGSALLTLPAPGLTLAHKQALNRALLTHGVPIGEMNLVRRHLSAVKGGRLARAAAAAGRMVTLVISDVPGDDPSVIASGPTVEPPPSTGADALAVLARHGIVPGPEVAAHLARPAPVSPPVTGEVHLIATPRMALEAAAAVARAHGVTPLILGDAIEGESRELGIVLAGIARSVHAHGSPVRAPALLLSGGETVVTMTNPEPNAAGGRNTELLLAFALAAAGVPGVAALAGDTDGIDGRSDAAGAIATADTVDRARALGLDPAALLDAHRSYDVFGPLGDLVKTGPTFTNVNDFRAVLIA